MKLFEKEYETLNNLIKIYLYTYKDLLMEMKILVNVKNNNGCSVNK